MKTLKELENLGQSIWLDFIDRNLTRTGRLKRLIDEDGITGVTSNPSIFEKAIAETNEYDAAFKDILARGDRNVFSLYDELAIKDIQDAADILYPVYLRLEGKDGFISLEVSPHLAQDSHATIEEARRLWKAVDRPNVMIKVPATKMGIPAIRKLIEEGINVNITLLFSVAVYEEVIEAYLEGLEARKSRDENLAHVASVASFFVSRIDTAVDKLLETHKDPTKVSSVLGKVAIANAKVAYETFQKMCSSPRWEKLAKAGARPQRLLWASTSMKNKKYRDVMYVEELIGRDTVNTVPTATLEAFKDHGKVSETLIQGLSEAKKTLSNLRELGIDLEQITSLLLTEGIEKFCDPFDQLLASLQKKREAELGKQLNRLRFQVPADIQKELNSTLEEWRKKGKVRAIWKHDASLWTQSGEEGWLGWLDVPAHELMKADELQLFADEVRNEGFSQIVLLGMGGSSLGAEVLEKTFGPAGVKNGRPKFHILDSTDPSQIKELEETISIDRTLFIVSSKSGSTLEPNIFYDYFYDRVKQRMGKSKAGGHFIAITDPGSSLEKKAKEANFRKIFFGVPSIGGRYSVLSNFGLVPAALMGIDVRKLLTQTLHMIRSCSSDVPPVMNPGVLLGSILGICAKHKRDKITFICSKEIQDLGAWLEQLLAESTGKQGMGLIPINREMVGPPESYGLDRVFVYLRADSSAEPDLDLKIKNLEQAGNPIIRIDIFDLYNLGQEFFRWEMATSVVGAMLGINPFDQPDVEASKGATRKLTSEYEIKGVLPKEDPILQNDDIQIFDDPANVTELKKHLGKDPTVSDYLRAHLRRADSGDYFAILAYIPMDSHNEEMLQSMRGKIMSSRKVATCVEFGPRFLHSTGQAYKGGPNSGVFLQITCDDLTDLPPWARE